MLKPLLLLPALLVAAYAPLMNSQQKPAHKPAAPEGTPPATIQVEPPRPEVKQIYKNDCAICHGDTGDGKGDIGKTMNLDDWTNPSALSGKSDEQLFNAIRKGSDGKMPPEDAARAKDNEIKGLVKYIRGMSKGQPGQPAAEPAAQPATTPAPASSSPTTK